MQVWLNLSLVWCNEPECRPNPMYIVNYVDIRQSSLVWLDLKFHYFLWSVDSDQVWDLRSLRGPKCKFGSICHLYGVMSPNVGQIRCISLTTSIFDKVVFMTELIISFIFTLVFNTILSIFFISHTALSRSVEYLVSLLFFHLFIVKYVVQWSTHLKVYYILFLIFINYMMIINENPADFLKISCFD